MVDVLNQGDGAMKTTSAQDPSMLDAWVRNRLRERYDAALQEPLPDDLLLLLCSTSERR